MGDRNFVDTNILVYSLLENEAQKHGQAVALNVDFVIPGGARNLIFRSVCKKQDLTGAE